MDHRDILIDAAQRPLDTAEAVLRGITPEALHAMPGSGNSIAWLVWHAARQMDVQTADLSGSPTVWTSGDWAPRLGVDREDRDFGLGDDTAAVASLHVEDADLLLAHLRACVEALTEYVATLAPADLDDIVDRGWNPPVTRGVRLVSIIDDAVAHLGQAAYARGLADGWSLGV